jgi:hypothetical protein
VRTANYVKTLRRDLLRVSEACGVPHPGLVDADDIEILFAQRDAVPLRQLVGYEPGWGSVGGRLRDEAVRLMQGEPQGGSAAPSATSQG